MDTPTLKARLVELMQKCRRATRAYASMCRGNAAKGDFHSELSDVQADIWRNVNAELLKQLASIVDHPNPKVLAAASVGLYQNLKSEITPNQENLKKNWESLVRASEQGDFVRVTILGKELVQLRAKFQALQAAHAELEQILKKSQLLKGGVTQAEQGTPNLLAPKAQSPDQYGLATYLKEAACAAADQVYGEHASLEQLDINNPLNNPFPASINTSLNKNATKSALEQTREDFAKIIEEHTGSAEKVPESIIPGKSAKIIQLRPNMKASSVG